MNEVPSVAVKFPFHDGFTINKSACKCANINYASLVA